MSLWESLVLGWIQGATEFLPVSSSGHLVIGQTLLGVEVPGVVFEVTVHLATLVSILLVYRKRVARLATGAVRREEGSWRYLGLLVLATIPAAVVGLLWRDALEGLFEAPQVVGYALIATGVFLWTTRSRLERGDWKEVTVLAAVAMGFAQSLALIPGVSRSGTTVVLGLWLGVDPKEAAAFSFLMAIPAIAGASVLQVPELLGGSGLIDTGVLVTGGLVAAVTGVLAIRIFVSMLESRAFHHFAPYVWVVGGGFLGYLALAG